MQSFMPITPEAHRIIGLFNGVLIISAVVLLIVWGVLVYVIVRFRARPGAGEPPQTAGSRVLEITWTAIPVALLIGVFIATVWTMAQVTSAAPPAPAAAAAGVTGPLRIQVVGEQWWWQFRYPELNVVTANELHVPVGVPVQLLIGSDDVIHSFWVPQLGLKMDAIPGRQNQMNFRVDQAGTFGGACAEFCGTQHAWMRLSLVAEPLDQFRAWMQVQQRPMGAPQTPLAAQGQKLFFANTCVNCHTIQGSVAQGVVGPDLTHLGTRRSLGAGVLENTPANVARWIHASQAIKPGNRMPNYPNFSDDDLRALAAYLEQGQ